MPWGAAAILGGAIISGVAQDKASDAQAKGAKNSLQLQQQEHDQTVQNLQPYNTAGQNALSNLQAANSGDYSSFYNNPAYKFAKQQGIDALDASAASRGNLYSGGYGEKLADYAGGLASQNYNSWYGQQMGLAGLGENAAAGVGNANSSYANAATGINTNAGNNAAAGALGQAGIWNNALNQFGSAYGQYLSTQTPGTGTTPVTDLGLGTSGNAGYLGRSPYSGFNNGTFNSGTYGGLGVTYNGN